MTDMDAIGTNLRLRVPVGVEWVVRGVLESEAGVDLLLASRSEPVPGFPAAMTRYREDLERSGIGVEHAESDAVAAGLLRAGLLGGRRIVGVFDLRGARQGFDALHEACRLHVPGRSGVIVLCQSRWPTDVRSGAEGRDLAMALRAPVLAPSEPAEIGRYVNEALRLSRVSGTPVVLLLSPTLMGGGETDRAQADPHDRGLPLGHHGPAEEIAEPILMEARRRQLDRVYNSPGPGEIVPLGFITVGTAHASLRHALHLAGAAGRFPILRTALIEPIDRRSIQHLLSRCRHVAVIESGRREVESAALGVQREMRLAGVHVAEIVGRSAVSSRSEAPATLESTLNSVAVPEGVEIHPSDLLECLAPILEVLRSRAGMVPVGAMAVESPLEAVRATAASARGVALEPARFQPAREGLRTSLVRAALADLAEELARPAADRPVLDLAVESIDEAPLEERENRRVVVLIHRRRLRSVAPAVVAHAIRRRLTMTFIVLADPPGRSSGVSNAEADRLIRGLIADAEAGRALVTTVDPAEGPAFCRALRQEVLREGVSVLIVDSGRATASVQEATNAAPTAGEPGEIAVERWVRPTSPAAVVCHEWLVRHGWDDPTRLDGTYAPRLDSPDPDDPVVTPLDGWEGFEELRVERKRPPVDEWHRLEAEPPPDPIPRHSREPIWRIHIAGPPGAEFEAAVNLVEQAGVVMGYRVQMVRGRGRAGSFAQMAFSRPRPGEAPQPITARIPYGSADLVVAMGLDGVAEAVAEGGGHRAASPERTALVLDLSPLGFAEPEAGEEAESTPVVPGELNRVIPPARRTVLRAADACERFLRVPLPKRLAGMVLVGIAFQRGFIPVSVDALGRAGHRVANVDAGAVQAAIRLGRALARWERDRIRPLEDRPIRPESLLRRHRHVMAARAWPNARLAADRFAAVGHGTLDSVTGLRRSDPARLAEQRFVARLIDCEWWGGLPAARAYAERVRSVYAAERSVAEYPVTRLVIRELARAMLIADPVFVSATVLRPDRRRADSRRMRVNRGAGERMTFRLRGRTRTAVAQSILGGTWRLDPLTARAAASLRVIRRLPWWCPLERAHRQWVEGLVDQCARELPQRASLWLEVFRQLARVRGFGVRREIRLTRVRSAVEALLRLGGTAELADAIAVDATGGSEVGRAGGGGVSSTGRLA